MLMEKLICAETKKPSARLGSHQERTARGRSQIFNSNFTIAVEEGFCAGFLALFIYAFSAL